MGKHLTPSLRKIKSHLMSNYGEITADSVMKLDQEWRTKAFNVLSGLVRDKPHIFKGYKNCSSRVDKRKFLVEFLQSETAPVCDSVRSVAAQDALQKRTYWKTVEQLSSSQFLGSQDHAAAFASKAPFRLHENSALAALGVKQYQYDETILFSAFTKTDQRTVARASSSEAVALDAERQMDEQESFATSPIRKSRSPPKALLDGNSKVFAKSAPVSLKRKASNCSPQVKKKLEDQVKQIAEWEKWFPSLIAKAAENNWDRIIIKPIQEHWTHISQKTQDLVRNLSDDSSTVEFKSVLSKLNEDLKPFTIRLQSLCKLIDFQSSRDLKL